MRRNLKQMGSVLFLLVFISILPFTTLAQDVQQVSVPDTPVSGSEQTGNQSAFATNTPVGDPDTNLFAINTPAGNPDADIFATNTPSGESSSAGGVFATNTPLSPRAVANPPSTPNIIDVYALRLWTPADYVSLMETQLAQLIANDTEDQRIIVQLTAYEAQQRYPNVFSTSTARETLLPLLLIAPRGSVDMRPIVRPLIMDALNNNVQPGQVEGTTTFTAAGVFSVTAQPINVSPVEENELILRITADTQDTVLYEEFILVRAAVDRYEIIPASPDYPAAPNGRIERVELIRIGDMNLDRAEEAAIALTYADSPNQELMIYGYRADQVLNLTPPNQTIQFTSLVDIPTQGNQITVLEGRQRDTFWGCIEEQRVEWIWGRNLFEPTRVGASSAADSLACNLDAAGNPFEQSVAAAVQTIESQIAQAGTTEEDTILRALLVMAVLQYLDGRPELGVTTVSRVLSVAPADSPRTGQAEAYLSTIGEFGLDPFALCVALDSLQPDSICDPASLVIRLLRTQSYTRDMDIVSVLQGRGLPVEQSTVISEVGRFDRLAVQVGENGAWFEFTLEASNSTMYTVMPIDPPRGFEPVDAPPDEIVLSNLLLTQLLDNDDPVGALNLTDNLLRDLPNAPLSGGVHFIRALSYDLLGSRAEARTGYYALWESQPFSIWGQFAAQHLEER